MTDDLPDHTNYSLIKAVDESGNLVTVLADSSGRIVSVMKGDYAGSMKTLAVDEKGRIQAVLTDPEDVFGNPNYIGAGELAARLGSIKRYEKRGEVVFMDDFEDATLKWTTACSGTGCSVARSNASARSGNYSMKLTAGDGVADYADIYHRHYLPPKKRYGFEYSFALGSGIWYFYSYLRWYTKTNYYNAVIVYSPGDKAVTLSDENGVSQTIASGIDLLEHDHLYHTCKVVVDLDLAKYVRLFLDDTEYDLSAYGIEKTAGSYTPYMYAMIEVLNYNAANPYAYIDDVIITQNES